MERKKYHFIFSINVHEKPDFLKKQINNIKYFVEGKYLIIINANDYMYQILNNDIFFKNNKKVIINPNYFNKKRYTGTLFKGIYLNMKYAINNLNINFKYFIVLSSRNLFYNKLNIYKLKTIPKNKVQKRSEINSNSWPHWNKIFKLKFSKYIIEKNMNISKSAHEGLVINVKSCIYIINFLEKDIDKSILNELYNCNACIEEYVLQTIISNFSYYYNIGNGTKTNNDITKLPNNKFVYKTIRN